MKFCITWLDDFPWLKYSPSLNGAFCLPCILFSNSSRQLVLLKNLLLLWTGAKEKLKNHCKPAKSSSHLLAVAQFEHFRLNRPIVVQQMCSDVKQRIAKNMKILEPIVESVILCGRQNVPLRGHRDDSQYIDDPDYNTGNFQELLRFAIKMGNTELDEHFKSAPRNATYRSPNIQNQLISCAGSFV